jgi:hypothetical protein
MHDPVRKGQELSPYQPGVQADNLRQGDLMEYLSIPDEAEVSLQVPAAADLVPAEKSTLHPEEEGRVYIQPTTDLWLRLDLRRQCLEAICPPSSLLSLIYF